VCAGCRGGSRSAHRRPGVVRAGWYNLDVGTHRTRRRRFRLVTICVAAVLLCAAQAAALIEPKAVAVLVAAGVGLAAAGGGLPGLVFAVFGAGLAPLDTPLRVAFGVGALAVYERVSHLSQETDRATEQSFTDHLTGLRSYAFFREALRHEVQRARRYGGCCALVVLDLDRFKEFNDRYGHAAGNQLLARVGGAILTATRQSDVAARFGGEELVVLVPGDATTAAAVAERIRVAVAAITVTTGAGRAPVGTTVSVGVAEYPQDAATADALFAAADAALYAAKRTGRNRVVVARAATDADLAVRRAG
jgi:diguanylate cyclase (GGDEF)-like protein